MCSSKKNLQGKVAIITGGASGIGEAAARHFADHGARMIVIADVQDDLGQQVAMSIGTDKCHYMHCDVTDEHQVKVLVDSTVQTYGQLDVMVSNAGVLIGGTSDDDGDSTQTVLELDLSAFDRLFAVNVRGMAACVKYAARAMVEGGIRGSIVCTASVAGSCGGEKRTDYSMSKHAVIGLVRSASVQLGAHGIRVNSVSPHGLATPMTLHASGGMPADEIEKLYETRTPLKGVVLRARHVADAVAFLACSDSEFVTGHDLVVDGGFLIKR